jgi:hypothetical protein
VAVLRAGGAQAVQSLVGAWAGAAPAMQAAAAVLHRRLTARRAGAGEGAAPWRQRGIACRRPILQPVAPRDMGFYLRQRGMSRGAGGLAGRCFKVSSCSRRQNRLDARAALAVS